MDQSNEVFVWKKIERLGQVMIKFLFISLLISLTSFAYTQEKNLRISPVTNESSGCDLKITGIDDREAFLNYFSLLKVAASKKNQSQIEKLVIFPLRVNSNLKHKVIKDIATLDKVFSSVFTPKILSMISSQQLEKLFCRDQGVMLGNGEVWLTKRDEKIGISAINL